MAGNVLHNSYLCRGNSYENQCGLFLHGACDYGSRNSATAAPADFAIRVFVCFVDCAAVICLLSPIASYKRPFKTKERYRLCKKWSILFTLAWSLILTFAPAPAYLQNCGVCYLVLQAVQMIAQSVYRYFKHKKSIGGLHDVQKNAL